MVGNTTWGSVAKPLLGVRSGMYEGGWGELVVAGTQCRCEFRRGRIGRSFGAGGCQEATGCVWVIDAGIQVETITRT